MSEKLIDRLRDIDPTPPLSFHSGLRREAADELERLRAALRKCDDGLNHLIAESDAFLVDDLQKMIREVLGDDQ